MRMVMVIVGYVSLALLEGMPLMRRRLKGEALAVLIITGLGAVYALGILAGWPLPNPADWVTVLFRPVAELLGAL